MRECADSELLRQYVCEDSEPAFAVLVERNLNLVYSAALRKTGNPEAAKEVAQAVFIILARKAHRLREGVLLSGWLYQAARLTAENLLRADRRRVRREQEAFMQSPAMGGESEAWPEIRSLLEDAMGTLGANDRNAILLRFFEGKSFQEIGTALQSSENAAKKRVAHALEKLHRYFSRRGISSPTVMLAGAISANSVSAVPAALAQSVSAVALAQGALSGSSTLTLIKGVLKMMAWAKAKTAIGVGVGILLAAGTATITVERLRAQETYAWQVPQADFETLHRTPPQVVIVPSRFRESGGAVGENDRVLGICQPLDSVAMSAYGTRKLRTVVEGELPKGTFDFIANLPGGASRKALQAELKRKFGIVGRLEKRETDILVLKSKATAAPGLQPGTHQPPDNTPGMTIAITIGPGQIKAYDQPIGVLISELENLTHLPVVDRSGLTHSYDITLHWDESDRADANLEGLKQALADQLGLELVPGRETIDMLVVKGER